METPRLTVPIFPLPDVVLFPTMMLPLHIFEPRYKEMITDVLAAPDQLVGLVQLRPGWEQDYYGTPSVYKTLGVGRIIKSRKWEDGRYDILLEGQYRAQILSENQQGQYRTAEVEVLKDYIPLESQADVEHMYSRLMKLVRVLLDAVPEKLLSFKSEDWENIAPGAMADLLAAIVVEDPYEKQSILSELDIARRLKLVQVQIRTVLNPGQ